MSQPCVTLGNVIVSGIIGGALGVGVGLLDPTEGIGTGALIYGTVAGGISGAVGDALGQHLVMRLHPDGPQQIHRGSIVGAGIGGAFGGLLGGLGAWGTIEAGYGETTATIVGNAAGWVPATFGAPIGDGLWDQ